jgi:hypothetical protein
VDAGGVASHHPQEFLSTMFLTRSSRRVTCGIIRASPTRFLSITTPIAARPRSPRAPKKSSPIPALQDGPLELQLPPVTMLKSAKKSGALDIEPERAQSILRDYAETYRQRKPGTWEKQFCAGRSRDSYILLLLADIFKEENITPRTLILLGLILIRCKGEARRFLGMALLFAASSLGEPSATIFLINSALQRKWLDDPEYSAPFLHLRKLAAPPHSNIEAMILLGKIYQMQGDKGTALQLFRQAASTAPSSNPPVQLEEKSPLPLPGEGVESALVYMGRILDEQGKTADAKEAFRKAALEHDYPTGYFHLAMAEGGHPNKTYLTKAAASGHIRAARGLGSLHHLAARNSPDGSASKAVETRMAEEWFHVAAVSGEPYSMLHLCDLLRSEGKWEAALSWAKVGEMCSSEDVAKKAKIMRQQLEDKLDDIKQRGKG